MDSTKRAIKFHYFDTKLALIKFWAVVLIVNICGYLVNIYDVKGINIGISSGEFFSITGMNIILILIYLIVYSYEMYYVSFPIAISFSITRKDFFQSLILNNILIASAFALIQGVFMKIDPILAELSGINTNYEFGIFNTRTDNLFFIIFSLFILFLFLISIWNLLASVNYKFGYGMWIVLAGLVILMPYIRKKDVVDLIFSSNLLTMRIDISRAMILGIIIVVSYILVYITTSRSNFKGKTI